MFLDWTGTRSIVSFFVSSLVREEDLVWSGSLVQEEDLNAISFFLSRAGVAHAVFQTFAFCMCLQDVFFLQV